MTGREPLWVFADQLGPHVHSTPEHADRDVVLVESQAALRRRRYHRQKLHLVLSGLRHLQAELGDRVRYVRADTYAQALDEIGEPVLVHQPTSWPAMRLVEDLQERGVVAEVLPTPTYALARRDFETWAGSRKSFRMGDFYRSQRERFGILLEGDGQPIGGRWSLDEENREPPPKGQPTLGVPPPWIPDEDKIDAQVRRDLDAWAIPTVGEDGPRLFAATRAEARQALDQFIAQRLASFGRYEDAMMRGDWWMSHSMLSAVFNLGLLQPLEAVRAAEQAYTDGAVGLASAEGFIRQVLGWREYVWHLYWHFGPDYREANALEAHTPLPEWFRELDAESVTAACLKDALGGVRDRAWTHHIPRLMVLGNHALQRGYDPDELTEWFQTSYIDGYDWVMPVNVVGMSQHADGGRMATKPYSGGGAYINRMSDYCGGCAYNPRKRLGADACPFTAGYWAWVHRHEDRLAANPRTSRAVQSMHRLADLDAVLEQERGRETF